jgi:hypothetical protein
VSTKAGEVHILVWSGQEFYAAHWAKNPYADDEAWITAEWGANNDRQQALVKPILWHEPPTMPNVQIEGLRAFAQSLSNAGLDLLCRKPCDDLTRIIIRREYRIENFPNKTTRYNDG